METAKAMFTASPVQSRLLSRINERLVIQAIQSRGPLTRMEVTKCIGVTFPTVAKAAASLLDSRLLEEFDAIESGPGRPAKRLRLANQTAQVLGVAIDHSSCTIVGAGMEGAIHEESKQAFPLPDSYDSLLVAVASQCKQLMQQQDVATLGIGISVPGLVDYRQQRVAFSANFPLISGKPFSRDLAALLGVECVLVHDSHALCLSQRLSKKVRGVSQEQNNFAILNLCRGIGMGMMVNGRVLTGYSGYAGEIGHISVVPDGDVCHCGKRGCLETVASEWALESRMSLLLRRPITIGEILKLVESGDKQAKFELEKMCGYLAMGVAYVINIVDPGTIYVSGQVFNTCPGLLELLVDKTKELALAPSFSACKFEHASSRLLDGTTASIINFVIDSLVPDLDGHVNSTGQGNRISEWTPASL